jgi:hypothetical protein
MLSREQYSAVEARKAGSWIIQGFLILRYKSYDWDVRTERPIGVSFHRDSRPFRDDESEKMPSTWHGTRGTMSQCSVDPRHELKSSSLSKPSVIPYSRDHSIYVVDACGKVNRSACYSGAWFNQFTKGVSRESIRRQVDCWEHSIGKAAAIAP